MTVNPFGCGLFYTIDSFVCKQLDRFFRDVFSKLAGRCEKTKKIKGIASLKRNDSLLSDDEFFAGFGDALYVVSQSRNAGNAVV